MKKLKYGYTWLTLGLFLISLTGHWLFGWFAYARDAADHGQTPRAGAYTMLAVRDTLENWQSEFLQLIWQVAGLALLLNVGSPSSKEGHERLEAKVDFLMSGLGGGAEKMQELDRRFPRA